MDSLLQRMGQEHEFFVSSKARIILDLLTSHVTRPSEARLLDVGCGVGLIEQKLYGKVGFVCGIDVSRSSIDAAVKNVPTAQFHHYGGETMPFDNNAFDATFASCVMHHIQPAARTAVLTEMVGIHEPS